MVRHVGVDVSKAWLDVALLDGERVRWFRAANDAAGHAAIVAWLARQLAGEPVHVCLEATGVYGFAFARAMHAAGHRVSLVNPSGAGGARSVCNAAGVSRRRRAQIKAFGGSELLRTRTDKVDAALIARFCRALQPAAPRRSPDRRCSADRMIRLLADHGRRRPRRSCGCASWSAAAPRSRRCARRRSTG
jgi:transposase